MKFYRIILIIAFSSFTFASIAQQQFRFQYHLFPIGENLVFKSVMGGGFLLTLEYTNRTLFTRFDDQLNVIWDKEINNVIVRSFYQNAVGNYFLICNGNTLIKTDSLLNIQWKNNVPISHYGDLKIAQTSSGHIFVCGTTFDPNFTQQLFIACLDQNGNSLWNGTAPNDTFLGSYSVGCDLVPSLNGSDKILVGYYYGDIYDTKISLFELDTVGNIIKTESWGGCVLNSILDKPTSYVLCGIELSSLYARIQVVNSNWQIIRCSDYNLTGMPTSIIGTHDGGYLLSTKKNISFNHFQPVILKVDSGLNPQWCRLFSSLDDFNVKSVIETSDKGFLITGMLDTTAIFVKTDSMGYSNCGESSLSVSPFNVTTGGFPFVTLNTSSNTLNNFSIDSSYSISSKQFDTLCFSITKLNDINSSRSLLVYPNPTTLNFTLSFENTGKGSIEIYNIFGKKVYSREILEEGYCELSIDVEKFNWPNGIYLVQHTTDIGKEIQRFIIQ